MMKRGKLEHILAYARQQKQFGSPTCRIPPGDMVEIMERLLAQPVSSGYTFNSPVIPDGWKLVPVEPTEDMLRAAYRESGVYSAKAYRAMLAAAPEGGNG